MRLDRCLSILDRPYAVALSRVGSAAIGLISAWILARSLGPDGRGEASAALATTAVIPIVLGLGVPLAVRRRAATRVDFDPTVRTARLLALLLLAPAGLIAWLCATTFLGSLDPAARIAFVVSAASSPLGFLWICNANILIAKGRHGAFALINLLPIAVYVALIGAGAALGAISVAFAITANWCSSIFTLFVTMLWVKVRLRGKHDHLGGLLSEGARYSGSQIAEAFSYRIHQMIALPVAGNYQAGLYSIAATIATVPFALGQAMASATFASIAGAKSRKTRADLVSTAIRSSFVISVITVSVIALLCPLLIPVLFGSEFEGAVPATLVALVGSVGVVVAYVTTSALTAVARGWHMTIAQTVGLAVGVALVVPLGANHGALGISVAATLGFWACAVVGLMSAELSPRQLVPRPADARSALSILLTRNQRD